ncbi:MAG: RcpC/CpaB family pilus assembly protein [Bacilli bacterium]|nr:RcpC/CpaB family pilus assembly protein [Bacilli bacterium]
MKKYINNKNIVSVLLLVVLIGILFFFYTRRVNDKINPITVPYAKVQIASGIQITDKMVGTTQIPPAMLTDDVYKVVSDVVGKYSNADTIIPAGSLFYHRNVVEKEELPANIILDIPDGYVLFNLAVDTATTYGNSIYPGNYIDIYLKARTKEIAGVTTDQKRVLLDRLIKNVKVIAVKDNKGKTVFKDLEEDREPAMVIFAVPEEYYILLKKAEFLRTYESILIPVPTNESLKEEPGELAIASEALHQWINDVTVWNLS